MAPGYCAASLALTGVPPALPMRLVCLPARRRCLWHLLGAALPLAGVRTAAAQADAPRLLQVVGERHKLLLRDDGQLWGWGSAQEGQLGPVAGLRLQRGQVAAPLRFELPGPVRVVAAGDQASLVGLDDGSVMAWGSGPLLGPGRFHGPEQVPPQRLPGLDGVVGLVAAEHNALALREDGSVWAWGFAATGLLGDGQAARRTPLERVGPQRVPGLPEVLQLSLSAGHALALGRDGQVWAWGLRPHALGRPPGDSPPLDSPAPVAGLREAAEVAAGAGVSLVRGRDGQVWVWGSNAQGQFGDGQRSDPPGLLPGAAGVPRPVPGVRGVVQLSVGRMGRHCLALLQDGNLRGWGNSDWGQLGAGVTADFQLRPVSPRLTQVQRVQAAGNQSFAQRRDGSLWVWGQGIRGEWPLQAHAAQPQPLRLG